VVVRTTPPLSPRLDTTLDLEFQTKIEAILARRFFTLFPRARHLVSASDAEGRTAATRLIIVLPNPTPQEDSLWDINEGTP
jgi:hypothetical protein